METDPFIDEPMPDQVLAPPKTRPTAEDLDALEYLLEREDLGEKHAAFLESLHGAQDEGWSWSTRQCAWFDELVAKYV